MSTTAATSGSINTTSGGGTSASTSGSASWAQSINFDYLAPTLSAIAAGVIHHIGREKKELTMMDFLLILSPSVPVISGLILKMIAFLLAIAAKGIEGGMNMGVFGKGIVWLSEKLNIKRSGAYKDVGFDEYGRMIFPEYTVDMNFSKKVAEWQKDGLYVHIWDREINEIESDANHTNLVYELTKTSGNRTSTPFYTKNIFRNFYTTLKLKSDGSIVHLYYEIIIAPEDMEKIKQNPSLSIYNEDIYKRLMIRACTASNTRIYNVYEVYKGYHYDQYKENQTSFRLSRIHNQHKDKILTAMDRYKLQRNWRLYSGVCEKKVSDCSKMRPVSLNFCFAGPPGTSKTYAARAIAAELKRTIVEVDLSKIVYEEEFFDVFKKNRTDSCVFLLDEIDLMCPSRELDDKLLKVKEDKRLEKLGMESPSSAGSKEDLSDSESETGSNSIASTQKGSGTSSSLVQHEILDRIIAIEKRINMIYHILDIFKHVIPQMLSLICYGIVMCYRYITNEPIPTDIKLMGRDDKPYLYTVLGKYCDCKNYITWSSARMSGNIDESHEDEEKAPFTLRTLLNFISGGNTPEGLIIIATTNRPEKLDPALIRPGRLRLVEFKNLRRCDAVALLTENFFSDEERAQIEEGLDRIGYQDYAVSGALLEAIMSSSNSVEEVIDGLNKELTGNVS